MVSLMQSKPWQALVAHQQTMRTLTLQQLFTNNPHRFTNFSQQLNELLIDYSKHFITPETLSLLIDLANAQHLKQKIKDLFDGKNVNFTENKPALHMALRDKNLRPEVAKVQIQMEQFIANVQNITDVIHIGVGGSDLGARLAINSLASYAPSTINFHFISALDGKETIPLMEKLNPATTLVIITSKTFTTADTMVNARTIRDWFQNKNTNWQQHFIGVSANAEKMTEFGILPKHQFLFWDWVGGRYSIWSAAGLVVALAIGMKNFKDFLAGAYLVDQHFLNTPFENNIPVILGLLSIWYNNFWDAETQAILPYDSTMLYFPAYLQQLEMESLGKSLDSKKNKINYQTGQIIWGGGGQQGQHAYYQLLHQGTRLVPVDFILPTQTSLLNLANALAQSRTLLLNNSPSTTFIFPKLTPRTLGMLLALYEHKVFVQSAIWDINAFDQPGVELGKEISKSLLSSLEQKKINLQYDNSTRGLFNFINTRND